MENLLLLGVQILKHITVYSYAHMNVTGHLTGQCQEFATVYPAINCHKLNTSMKYRFSPADAWFYRMYFFFKCNIQWNVHKSPLNNGHLPITVSFQYLHSAGLLP